MKFTETGIHTSLMIGVLSLGLTACGSSSDNDDTDTGGLNGITIDANNAELVLQTGLLGAADSATNIMFAANEIDTSRLAVLEFTEDSFTYGCDNADGTLVLTTLSSDTQRWDFSNCHITEYDPDSSYDGRMTTSTTVNSGTTPVFVDYSTDWDISQAVTFENFAQRSPIDGGDTLTANGSANLDSSNNVALALNRNTMSSTNLTIDNSDADSGAVTTYTFSDIYFDFQEDTDNGSQKNDLDFTADITGIGDLQLTTDPELIYDENEDLQAGAMVATTGNSSIKITATGNDVVTVDLDVNNDGNYDLTIPYSSL